MFGLKIYTLLIVIAYMFEFLLKNHQWHIDYHDCERDEIDVSDYSDHQIFMTDSGSKECKEQSQRFVNLTSSQWVVHMSHEEAVNGEIPFPPILRKITSIPPIVIEAPICKASELTPEVHVGMEHRVEDHKPQVRCRHTHVEGLAQNLQIVLVSQRLNCCTSYREHVLINKVTKMC